MAAPAPRVLVAVSQSGYGLANWSGCCSPNRRCSLADVVRAGLHAALQTVGADGLVDLTRGELSAWEREALLEMRARCWPDCDSSKVF